ncbi:hypothetical protein ACHAPT_006438 [Fusarium lateritium]
MPTATEFFGCTVTNLGPLTTTYTAPAECATVTDNIYFAPAQYPHVGENYLSCTPGDYGKCIPSGDAYDKLAKEHAYTWEQDFIPYYSPGIACPKGWTIAGEYARGKGTPTEGMLTVRPEDTVTGGVHGTPFLTEIWTEVLEDSETLAYCCPSGFRGDDGLNCHSVMGALTEFSYTEGCYLNWPWTVAAESEVLATFGGVESTYLSKIKNTVEPTTGRWTQTAITADDEMVVVATRVPAVALVYQREDMKKGKDSGSIENRASATLSVRGVMSVVTVLVSVLAGAGLLAPW